MARSRRIRRRLLLSALVVASALALRPLAAAAQPLPRLPQTVWELYLPEEYNGCGVMYGLYARLPEADRAKLHAGTKIPLDASTLTRDQAGVLAAWFNSARWGCDPPAENLDANAVGGSTIVLKCEDNVVEFCLQSPEQGIWKKLTIACAPERAEWVRDGLPLLPHWALVSWSGGHKPPRPVKGDLSSWLTRRPFYAVYVELDVTRLRQLHREGQLTVPLAEINPLHRRAIAEAVDQWRLRQNENGGWSPEKGRPADAVGKCYGIRQLLFRYHSSIPGVDAAAAAVAANPPGMNPCPRPFKTVWVTIDPSIPGPQEGAPVWWSHQSILIAAPAALQRSLLEWRRANDEWLKQWTYNKGQSTFFRDGAPPRPRHPR